MTSDIVGFRLILIPGEDLAFYECDVEGCIGCGCPTFSCQDGAIELPNYVIDHLLIHARMKHEQ